MLSICTAVCLVKLHHRIWSWNSEQHKLWQQEEEKQIRETKKKRGKKKKEEEEEEEGRREQDTVTELCYHRGEQREGETQQPLFTYPTR